MIILGDETGKTLQIEDKTLLVFIDETGTEGQKDPTYPIFGMGGCMVPSSKYSANIRKPWLFLKNKEFNGEMVSLHATDLVKQKPSKHQIDILNKFFSSCAFGRFATVISDKTVLNTKERPYHIIVASLFQRISVIAANSEFEDIIIIVEETQSSDNLNRDFFGRYKIRKNGIDVPTKTFKMPKKMCEPGLEVADFIIHTAGTGVRDRLAGKRTKENERPDFENIFTKIDSRLSSFMEITQVSDIPPFNT